MYKPVDKIAYKWYTYIRNKEREGREQKKKLKRI